MTDSEYPALIRTAGGDGEEWAGELAGADLDGGGQLTGGVVAGELIDVGSERGINDRLGCADVAAYGPNKNRQQDAWIESGFAEQVPELEHVPHGLAPDLMLAVSYSTNK
jgi:hypothetical protein